LVRFFFSPEGAVFLPASFFSTGALAGALEAVAGALEAAFGGILDDLRIGLGIKSYVM
jgi:hypothetical protein